MQDSLEQLFALYRLHGDADALSQVFDRTAPRLLRLAIHLVGDVSVAEDLVQSTFVTAIEDAPSFDPRRALEPWLTGILTNRARELRRSARRAPDLERLIERVERTPLEEAQNAELSGALAEAIDKLPEPYRRTLVLRLRHGMKPADIAHALDESPGATRVRIYRGLEMLKKLLPAGFASSALFLVEPSRGLAAVKQFVIAKAAAQAAAVSSVAVIGGIVVGKKLLVLAAALLALLAALWIRSTSLDDTTASPIASDTHVADPDTSQRTSGSALVPAESTDTRSTVAASANPAAAVATEVVPVRGKVIDGETGAPIAGARVQLFPPRKALLSDIKRRWSDRLRQESNGSVSTWDPWPWIPGKMSDAALADLEAITVYDPPLPGTIPLGETTTNPQGEYEFQSPKPAGFLVCESDGYETRRWPALRTDSGLKVVHGQQTEFEIEYASSIVRMWRPRHLSGRVIDPEGNVIRQRFRLRFGGRKALADEPVHESYDPMDFESWVIETQTDGAFEVDIAAPYVQAECIDAGWTLVQDGIHPDRKELWSFKYTFEPGKETEPAYLVARHVAALCVRDAATHAPIELFMLQGEGKDGTIYLRWNGRFFAAEGRLALVGERIHSQSQQQSLKGRFEFTIWAEGYLTRTVSVVNLFESPDVLVDLERGEPSLVTGTILERGSGVAGVTVAFSSIFHGYWRTDNDTMGDAAISDADGHFKLRVPDGDFVLRCTRNGTIHCEPVHVPPATPILIDLSRVSTLQVRVRDSQGTPRAHHWIGMTGQGGRSSSSVTDDDGEALFTDLLADHYTLQIAHKPDEMYFRGGEMAEVDLQANEQHSLDVVVPAADPRQARLFVEGEPVLDGWRARNSFRRDVGWAKVAADGTIPIDIQLDVRQLEIEGPSEGRWLIAIPENPPDGFPIRISLDGLGYDGVLVNGIDGQPLPRMRITASSSGKNGGPRTVLSCVTDAGGHFHLRGLAEGEAGFMFQRAVEDSSNGAYSGLYFIPSTPPTSPPAALTITISPIVDGHYPGLAERRFSGRVRVGGEERSKISVSIEAEISAQYGTLRIRHPSAYTSTDVQGNYTLTAPAAAKYVAWLYDSEKQKRWPGVEWASTSSGDDEVHDFDLK